MAWQNSENFKFDYTNKDKIDEFNILVKELGVGMVRDGWRRANGQTLKYTVAESNHITLT